MLRAAARITIHRPCKARDVRTLAKLIKLLNSLREHGDAPAGSDARRARRAVDYAAMEDPDFEA